MENIALLPVTETARKAIVETDQNYRRHKKVRTDVLAVDGNTVTVRVEQFDRPGDQVFEAKELISIGKAVFSQAQNLEIRWRPLVWSGAGMDAVGPEWVRSMAKKHGLSQTDLCEALGVDKYVMSKLLSGKYEFTKWHRAAFWHYFKGLK